MKASRSNGQPAGSGQPCQCTSKGHSCESSRLGGVDLASIIEGLPGVSEGSF